MANAIRSVTVGIAVSDLAEAMESYRNLLGPREELDPLPISRASESFVAIIPVIIAHLVLIWSS